MNRLEILDLLPETERVDAKAVFIQRTSTDDPASLVQAFLDWMNYLRDEVRFPADDLGETNLSVYQAIAYHHNIYNDFHALYFHNLRQSDSFDETMRLAVSGLTRLPTSELYANLTKAIVVYKENEDAWVAPRFSGNKRAREVMKGFDRCYQEIGQTHDLDALLADAIRSLPKVHFVSSSEYERVSAAALRSNERRNDFVRDALEKRNQKRRDEEAAERTRVARTLHNDVEFALELLATMSGYLSVVSISPEGDQEEDGSFSCWLVVLRTDSGGTQFNRLLRRHGKYGLLDLSMENARGVISERDVKRGRSEMLKKHTEGQTPWLRKIFGRSK